MTGGFVSFASSSGSSGPASSEAMARQRHPKRDIQQCLDRVDRANTNQNNNQHIVCSYRPRAVFHASSLFRDESTRLRMTLKLLRVKNGAWLHLKNKNDTQRRCCYHCLRAVFRIRSLFKAVVFNNGINIRLAGDLAKKLSTKTKKY